MAELRGGRDESDDGDSSPRRLPADSGDGAPEIRPRHEPRSRAEYADIARQATNRTTSDQEEVDHGASDKATDLRQEASDKGNADREDADQPTEPSNSSALERFDPRRVGLPEVSRADAAAYIQERQSDRPWLAPARDCSPDAQRVIVALDQGGGHGHIRHDGWVTEEMNERRVRNLEDPAQLDPAKRENHIDAFKPGDKSHRCGAIATRITDPEVFATVIARVSEDPEVRAALDSTEPFAVPVRLRISDVLGEDGHKGCSGWQLEPVNGSMIEAVANRKAWVQGDHSVPEPRTRPVETFEGGTMTFTFCPSAFGGHQFNTIFVNPPDQQST